VDTRDYYTHWIPDLRDKALRAEELFYATNRLIAMMEILLLQDLGFPVEHKAYKSIVRRRLSWLS
jgi:hypothetical protein